jgi:hypothetical protein
MDPLSIHNIKDTIHDYINNPTQSNYNDVLIGFNPAQAANELTTSMKIKN